MVGCHVSTNFLPFFPSHLPHNSYKALGLLTDIPLPKSASSHAKPTVYDSVDDIEAGPKITGYGQIIRDAEGNIIDVIIPDDEEQNEDEDEMDVEGGVSGAKGKGKRIEAKTEVVKGEHNDPLLSFSACFTKEHPRFRSCKGREGGSLKKFMVLGSEHRRAGSPFGFIYSTLEALFQCFAL